MRKVTHGSSFVWRQVVRVGRYVAGGGNQMGYYASLCMYALPCGNIARTNFSHFSVRRFLRWRKKFPVDVGRPLVIKSLLEVPFIFEKGTPLVEIDLFSFCH